MPVGGPLRASAEGVITTTGTTWSAPAPSIIRRRRGLSREPSGGGGVTAGADRNPLPKAVESKRAVSAMMLRTLVYVRAMSLSPVAAP
jgi:hypothetical protein